MTTCTLKLRGLNTHYTGASLCSYTPYTQVLHFEATHNIRWYTLQLNTLWPAAPAHLACSNFASCSASCILHHQQHKVHLAVQLHSASLVEVALISLSFYLSALGTTSLSVTDSAHGESKFVCLLFSSPSPSLSNVTLSQHLAQLASVEQTRHSTHGESNYVCLLFSSPLSTQQ